MVEVKTLDSWKELEKKLPSEYFAAKIDRSRKLRPELCLIVLREVVDPVLARSLTQKELNYLLQGSTPKIMKEKIVGMKLLEQE